MKFYAQLTYIIPGNFVGWRIRPIIGVWTPKKPDDYTIEGIEVLASRNITISQTHPFSMPRVNGAGALKTAVFEFEKTGRKTFRLIRYVGELDVSYTISRDDGEGDDGVGIPQTESKMVQVKVSSTKRWENIDI